MATVSTTGELGTVANWNQHNLPDLLGKRYGLDLKSFGPPLVVIYLLSDVGSVSGGWLSGRLMRRGWSVNAARKLANPDIWYSTTSASSDTNVVNFTTSSGAATGGYSVSVSALASGQSVVTNTALSASTSTLGSGTLTIDWNFSSSNSGKYFTRGSSRAAWQAAGPMRVRRCACRHTTAASWRGRRTARAR